MNISHLHELFVTSKGVCTDTRNLEPNTIFFALKGANFNGNEYAQKAIDEGCSYAIVDEAEYKTSDQIFLVDDVLETLQKLANFHRKQFDIPILGITGSNGKTTSKELIGAVLKKKYNVLITEGNLNNHLGVPFTLLKLNSQHDFAVIEMGANKPGDIQELVEIAEPNHGIITNVGAAHIEGFGSLEGVIQTKTAMYRWMEKVQGVIFCNADDETLKSHLPKAPLVTYGEESANIQGELVEMNPFVSFKWNNSTYHSEIIETKLTGRYNFTNFLAAVCIGDYFGVQPAAINEALSNYQPSNNRSQIQKSDRNTLIVDCYNANATSMKAAIQSFAEITAESKLAIVGDMLELGEISNVEHQKIVDLLNDLGLKAILVGKEFQKTNSNFPKYSNFIDLLDNEDLSSINNFSILLKGSRGIKLENLIQYL
ncbi:UDP-N-acetylmuramoyl-tripeptide--D-alanyl-D-alanine ligase [Paracrocinitomix mangrovi]|uniref:UDP-N-acetylmuramoyl-tripeptide--D-alanyl-D- alanine ligase n=1 Tax=Paracrocinitomix mangrovi TaxID=2862509 RepID=UPI001C8E84F8|nr:UDP-N-acetylmuramoyl-tripeptide--D-alanyl-D-alanine ligase [Paracrocinitomix mangrovi]UKN03222.1 UDP-N-acetylmuramoyl-tripeptide--D-alanyl-D-alanine ligase [Paracrocinitomix mangrovi]